MLFFFKVLSILKLKRYQPVELAGFTEGFSNMEKIPTIQTDEYNILLSIGYVDYEIAIDTVEI